MFCSECGLDNRDRAKFCANCGKSLRGGSARPSSHIASKRKKPVKFKKKKVQGAIKQALKPSKKPTPRAAFQAQQTVSQPVSQVPSNVSGLLPVGFLLDRRYEVKQHIATGGMGAIYRGQDSRLGTTIAIKEMLDFFQSHEDREYAKQRFREEALLLADLRHQNIPRVTDNFIENSRYYLIMDFVEGKNTEKLLAENNFKGLDIDTVVSWAVQICDVLHYLHTRTLPVIYRDMKPTNIMICKNNRVMLVDFGIARHFTPRRPGTMIGTHGYAPPEQYKGNTEPRSDLYALGATLHHLISGNDPTQGVPFSFKPIRFWRKDAGVRLEKILDKAVQNRLENRYQSALEMKNAFLALSGKTGSVNPGQGSRINVSAPVPLNSSKAPSPPYYSPVTSDTHSSKAESHYMEAKKYIGRNRLRIAKKELDRALKFEPDYHEALSLMGLVLTKMGDPVLGLKYLDRAVKIEPSSATAHFYRGQALKKAGNYHEANIELRQARNLDPSKFKKRDSNIIDMIFGLFMD